MESSYVEEIVTFSEVKRVEQRKRSGRIVGKAGGNILLNVEEVGARFPHEKLTKSPSIMEQLRCKSEPNPPSNGSQSAPLIQVEQFSDRIFSSSPNKRKKLEVRSSEEKFDAKSSSTMAAASKTNKPIPFITEADLKRSKTFQNVSKNAAKKKNGPEKTVTKKNGSTDELIQATSDREDLLNASNNFVKLQQRYNVLLEFMKKMCAKHNFPIDMIPDSVNDLKGLLKSPQLCPDEAGFGVDRPISLSNKITVLAYSGGLSSSCVLSWLVDQGYKVHCFLAMVGQEENFKLIDEKAIKVGAKACFIQDLRHDFLNNYVYPCLMADAHNDKNSLLGSSLSRACIVSHLAKFAKKIGANYIAHGALPKADDQIRLELAMRSQLPKHRILSPWRNPDFFSKFNSRRCMHYYLEEERGFVKETPQDLDHSIDWNLMSCFHQCESLADLSQDNSDSRLFSKMTTSLEEAPPAREWVEIEFKNGIPYSVIGQNTSRSCRGLDVYRYLNKIGGKHGVGRMDIIENTLTGLKSRGIYELPGFTVLKVAHRDLENIMLDKNIQKTKTRMSSEFIHQISKGYWFGPECPLIKDMIVKSQIGMDGKIAVSLYKGNVTIHSRILENNVYDSQLIGKFYNVDSDAYFITGFINARAMRLKREAEMQALRSTNFEPDKKNEQEIDSTD